MGTFTALNNIRMDGKQVNAGSSVTINDNDLITRLLANGSIMEENSAAASELETKERELQEAIVAKEQAEAELAEFKRVRQEEAAAKLNDTATDETTQLGDTPHVDQETDEQRAAREERDRVEANRQQGLDATGQPLAGGSEQQLN